MDSLIALSRAEQERAKKLLRLRICDHAVVLVLSLVSLFLHGGALYVIAVLVLVGNFAAWCLRWLASEAHFLAEEGRRRGVLSETLGGDTDSLGAAELLTKFGAAARIAARRWDDPSYFATRRAVGPERLREALQESSFWSARLYRAAGRAVALRLSGVVSVIVVAVLLIVLVSTPDVATLAARVTVVTLSALIGLDELGLMLAFFGASRTSDRVSRLLQGADTQELSPLLAAYSDYSVATASAPPIPTPTYLRNRGSIERAWSRSKA